MTRRRAIYIAATVTAALLATLSLGAREDWREPSPETCKTNLEAVFDWCGIKSNSGCKYVDDAELDACEAGCVMAVCPEQITCTELDPIWCGKSCADPSGARFWANSYDAWIACEGMLDHLPVHDGVRDLTDAQMHAYMGCLFAHEKQQCPELTSWPQRPPPTDDPAE